MARKSANHPATTETKAPVKKSNQRPIFSPSARLWHNAFIGKTGSGKTYAARGEVEILLDEGARVVIIDPTGAWYGLRMNPDGTPSGRNIAIFGGEFGDRVLTPDMAPTLGRVAGRSNQSMILDLSGTSLEIEDQREIVYQFLKGLYQTSRAPLHLVIDEADEYSPQELDKDTKPLRTMVARIMARGRSLGFRCTLITQRPAKIDKNSLSQVESMVCLRVTAPQDRKAIEDWFDDKGGINRKDAIGGLGSLATGEGWVFVANEGLYEHRRFRQISSYDSSQTPIDASGNPIELKTGPIDLAEIDAKIAYPDATSEEELEVAITRRRNLEADNKRLRARLLMADARYEAMRRFFVQIKQGIDEILAVDSIDAVDLATLISERDEVLRDMHEIDHPPEALLLEDTSMTPATPTTGLTGKVLPAAASSEEQSSAPTGNKDHADFLRKKSEAPGTWKITDAERDMLAKLTSKASVSLKNLVLSSNSSPAIATRTINSLIAKGHATKVSQSLMAKSHAFLVGMDSKNYELLARAAETRLADYALTANKYDERRITKLQASKLIDRNYALASKVSDALHALTGEKS